VACRPPARHAWLSCFRVRHELRLSVLSFSRWVRPVVPVWLVHRVWLTGACATLLSHPAAHAAGVTVHPGLSQDGTLSVNADADPRVTLTAQSVRSLLDHETVASGEVELRRSGLLLTADLLRYLDPTQLVIAQGHVRLTTSTDVYAGHEAHFKLDTRTGFVLSPTYHFGRTDAGGSAQRIDILGPQRVTAFGANYSSCKRTDGEEPGWELRMERLDVDFDANEGIAHHAQLRFLGVPIFAAPVLSFPATAEGKSGWLPPTLGYDNRGGAEVSEPYYWRIAPNRDMTLTPIHSLKRGSALRTEYRYLEPADEGRAEMHWVPYDAAAGRQRYSFQMEHLGSIGPSLNYSLSWQDASDDSYWKDFPRLLPSLTQRLLPQQAGAQQHWSLPEGELSVYAQVQGWRVLQDVDNPITVPYQRMPQVGLRLQTGLAGGLELAMESEVNRFSLADQTADDTRGGGDRVHLLASLSRPVDVGWGWYTPKVAVNGAAYAMDGTLSDGRQRAQRVIPTYSLDSGLRFERDIGWFGHDSVQTLEPRLHLVDTPKRQQSTLPLFDTAASDFNDHSIYADNEFTGVDRVSDARQVTVGATTRVIDAANGVERVRFGAAQRFQFRGQALTVDDQPNKSRVSDLLLFASGRVSAEWRMDTTMQFNPGEERTVRSIVSARYSPGPFQTLSGTYRYARDLNEQFELGYQWPVYRGNGTGSGQCSGSLYAVGRANYSLKDHHMADSLFGMEYDAGCWLARVVVERITTSQAQTTVRPMIQLELVGLSRLGSNPLKVLKDNIPGYRLLRDDAAAPSSTVNP
jgi:LPS-assembly protein